MSFPRTLFKLLRSDKHLRIVIGLSFFAFFFKLYLLSQRSLYIDPDEGYYLILARNLLNGNGYTFNGLPNIIFPPLLPMVIAFFYSFIGNLQLSLNIITALSGTLLGLMVYLISRKKFSLFASFGCLLLTLFVYQLNSFLPISAPYTEILYRGSDIFNCLLVLISLYFTILLIEKNRYRFSVLAGLSLSLAYLTRPEGFLLFLALSALLIMLKLVSWISLSFKKLICFFFVFVLFSFPYVFYLKKTTGKWILSGKISASQKYRGSLLEVIKKEDWAPFNKIHYSLNQESTEMNDSYFGFHKHPDPEENIDQDSPIKRAAANLALFWIVPKTLFSLPFLPFFLLGIAVAVIQLRKKRSLLDLVLLLLLPYSLLIEALSYPIPRHHLFLIPIYIIYAAEGAAYLSSKLSPKNDLTRKKILFLVFSVWLVFIIYEYIIKSTRNLLDIPIFKMARQVEVSLSQSLKKKEAGVIMSSHPSFAVRASSDWQVLPIAAMPQIFRFAKHKQVDYIIIPEGKKFFYHIIEMKDSYIPDSYKGQFEYQVLEKTDFCEWIRLIKKD